MPLPQTTSYRAAFHTLLRSFSSILAPSQTQSNSSMSVPRDVREFLEDYPDNEDDPSLSANLRFYRNELRCRPDNMLIDGIHEKWKGDYSKLEYKHGFIQWLFPIQEYGMNYESQPLQRHERQTMREDPAVVDRVVNSYKLMLDFYGIRLEQRETGLLSRSTRNHAERYKNLVRSQHNYLRISRILKHLSEMGLEHLNAGFLLHILNEQSEHSELNTPAIRSSMDRWWANCIRNDEEREWIGEAVKEVRTGSLVFTRQLYEEALGRRRETGHLDAAAAPDRPQVEGTATTQADSGDVVENIRPERDEAKQD